MINCIVFLMLLSLLSFGGGRLIPKNRIRCDSFPFAAFSWEQGGRVYTRLKIQKWQGKLPDMSRILPWMMPSKKIECRSQEKLEDMVRETCVAELIHTLNCLLSLYGLRLCPGPVGLVLVGLYIFVGNLPYVLIQRYNRPRLQHLLQRMRSQRKGNCNEQSKMEPACTPGGL